MLLRTALLLLLCVSAAICATLGHYQARAEEEEEAPAVTDAADFDAAPADVAVDDPPAAEKPAPSSLFNLMNNLGAEADDPAADKPEVEEEPETKSEAPAVETFTGEDVTETQPSEEETVTQQKPAEEEIAQEKTSDESRQKPAQEEEEDNEIKAVQTDEALSSTPLAQEERSSWSFNSIRNSLQNMHGYFESMVELVGGEGGVCQYKCRYGETPQPRPGYQLPEPNGCSSSLVGFQLDMGIPAMKQCCDQLDVCYDTCGASKYDCDSKFRSCLHALCSDVNKSLGFVSKVEACESMADTLFNTVWTLGCRPYMNSQRAACVCAGEERDEL